MEKLLCKLKIGEISVATTIAVSCLGIALVVCVATGADPTVANGIAGGLAGYVGGRVQNAKEGDCECKK